MDTLNRTFSTIILMAAIILASSCKSDKSVHAVVQVFQEHTDPNGQKTIEPISQALVKFYSSRPQTEHIYAEVLTDPEGKAKFDFEYEVIIYCDVIAGAQSQIKIPLQLLPGQTHHEEVILPE